MVMGVHTFGCIVHISILWSRSVVKNLLQIQMNWFASLKLNQFLIRRGSCWLEIRFLGGLFSNLLNSELCESQASVACWVSVLFSSLLGGDNAVWLPAPCCVCVVRPSSPTSPGQVHMGVSERAGSAYSPCPLRAFRYVPLHKLQLNCVPHSAL